MFPLSDLSILFLALLIIALLCLGLIILLGIVLCRNGRDSRQRNISQPDPPIPQQSLDQTELDKIKKEILVGTNIAIYGLAFAFTIYAVQKIVSDNVLDQWFGFAGWVLALIMLSLTESIVRKWISTRSDRFKKSVDGTRICFWIVLLGFTIWLLFRIISNSLN